MTYSVLPLPIRIRSPGGWRRSLADPPPRLSFRCHAAGAPGHLMPRAALKGPTQSPGQRRARPCVAQAVRDRFRRPPDEGVLRSTPPLPGGLTVVVPALLRLHGFHLRVMSIDRRALASCLHRQQFSTIGRPGLRASAIMQPYGGSASDVLSQLGLDIWWRLALPRFIFISPFSPRLPPFHLPTFIRLSGVCSARCPAVSFHIRIISMVFGYTWDIIRDLYP